MSNPLRTAEDYELFGYTLAEQFPIIRRSTLIFVRYGATLARVAGELYFDAGIRLFIREDSRLIASRWSLMAMATKPGRPTRSCIGTIRNPIQMTQHFRSRIHIINMFRPISNIIACLRQD